MTHALLRPGDPPDRPADCAAFESVVNAVLDRELGPDALDGDHPAACPDCRALAAAARLLLGAPVVRPHAAPGLTEQIVAVVVRDRRARRRRRVVGLALAASLLLGAGAVLLQPPAAGPREVVHVPPDLPVAPEAPPPRVSDQFAEAGSAVMAITRRARDRTVNPTRTLIPPPESVTVPTALPGIEPAAESLAGMPDGVRSGIEPVTDKTRRAVNLFLRDVGIGTPPKSKL